ncbi:hypothetical protein Vretimale_13701 [Volvox reticuliferus]|uniref:SET domain-containing protein n=1 Tax=Volvox reticuliferus TaxID=1737510 RepID=A0A8J4LUC0_9CHLO|nr:hypothetical protein Vretimale_13701 [Volvox reticuliferus]
MQPGNASGVPTKPLRLASLFTSWTSNLVSRTPSATHFQSSSVAPSYLAADHGMRKVVKLQLQPQGLRAEEPAPSADANDHRGQATQSAPTQSAACQPPGNNPSLRRSNPSCLPTNDLASAAGSAPCCPENVEQKPPCAPGHQVAHPVVALPTASRLASSGGASGEGTELQQQPTSWVQHPVTLARRPPPRAAWRPVAVPRPRPPLNGPPSLEKIKQEVEDGNACRPTGVILEGTEEMHVLEPSGCGNEEALRSWNGHLQAAVGPRSGECNGVMIQKEPWRQQPPLVAEAMDDQEARGRRSDGGRNVMAFSEVQEGGAGEATVPAAAAKVAGLAGAEAQQGSDGEGRGVMEARNEWNTVIKWEPLPGGAAGPIRAGVQLPENMGRSEEQGEEHQEQHQEVEGGDADCRPGSLSSTASAAATGARLSPSCRTTMPGLAGSMPSRGGSGDGGGSGNTASTADAAFQHGAIHPMPPRAQQQQDEDEAAGMPQNQGPSPSMIAALVAAAAAGTRYLPEEPLSYKRCLTQWMLSRGVLYLRVGRKTSWQALLSWAVTAKVGLYEVQVRATAPGAQEYVGEGWLQRLTSPRSPLAAPSWVLGGLGAWMQQVGARAGDGVEVRACWPQHGTLSFSFVLIPCEGSEARRAEVAVAATAVPPTLPPQHAAAAGVVKTAEQPVGANLSMVGRKRRRATSVSDSDVKGAAAAVATTTATRIASFVEVTNRSIFEGQFRFAAGKARTMFGVAMLDNARGADVLVRLLDKQSDRMFDTLLRGYGKPGMGTQYVMKQIRHLLKGLGLQPGDRLYLWNMEEEVNRGGGDDSNSSTAVAGNVIRFQVERRRRNGVLTRSRAGCSKAIALHGAVEAEIGGLRLGGKNGGRSGGVDVDGEVVPDDGDRGAGAAMDVGESGNQTAAAPVTEPSTQCSDDGMPSPGLRCQKRLGKVDVVATEVLEAAAPVAALPETQAALLDRAGAIDSAEVRFCTKVCSFSGGGASGPDVGDGHMAAAAITPEAVDMMELGGGANETLLREIGDPLKGDGVLGEVAGGGDSASAAAVMARKRGTASSGGATGLGPPAAQTRPSDSGETALPSAPPPFKRRCTGASAMSLPSAVAAPAPAGPAPSLVHLHGYVPASREGSSGLPPLRPGELRICGLTFHPGLAPAVRRCMSDWQAALGDGLANADPAAVQIFLPSATANSSTLPPPWRRAMDEHRLSANIICSRLARLLGLMAEDCEWDAPLPADALELVAEVAPAAGGDGCGGADGDCNGGMGLVATAPLRRNAVLGVVGGYVMPAGEAARFASRGFRQCPGELISELRQRAAPADLAVAWQFLAGAFRMPYMELELMPEGAAEPASLELNMLGYGNMAALINDPRVRPQAWLVQNDVDDPRPANCMVLPVCVRGLVLPVLVALRDIVPGEQLLRDYGAAWWRDLSRSWEVLDFDGVAPERLLRGLPPPLPRWPPLLSSSLHPQPGAEPQLEATPAATQRQEPDLTTKQEPRSKATAPALPMGTTSPRLPDLQPQVVADARLKAGTGVSTGAGAAAFAVSAAVAAAPIPSPPKGLSINPAEDTAAATASVTAASEGEKAARAAGEGGCCVGPAAAPGESRGSVARSGLVRIAARPDIRTPLQQQKLRTMEGPLRRQVPRTSSTTILIERSV